MGSGIINCKQCGAICQTYTQEKICIPCHTYNEEMFTVLYRTLQRSASQGGIMLVDLAAEVGAPVKLIEKYYWEGRFSTAGRFLRLPCHGCGLAIEAGENRGRYCSRCTQMAATKAGVEVKSLQTIHKEEADDARRVALKSLLDKRTNQPTARFGNFCRQSERS